MSLSANLPGSWRLLSRVDVAANGESQAEPVLGEDPVALLIYDRAGNFSAQFMRRGREGREGFDAYFGTYAVDDATGEVTQRLDGALDPAMVGSVVRRVITLDGEGLTIRLGVGRGVVRTLTWERVG